MSETRQHTDTMIWGLKWSMIFLFWQTQSEPIIYTRAI